MKPVTLVKLTLLHGYLSRFLNCANGAKSRSAPHTLVPLLPNTTQLNHRQPIISQSPLLFPPEKLGFSDAIGRYI